MLENICIYVNSAIVTLADSSTSSELMLTVFRRHECNKPFACSWKLIESVETHSKSSSHAGAEMLSFPASDGKFISGLFTCRIVQKFSFRVLRADLKIWRLQANSVLL